MIVVCDLLLMEGWFVFDMLREGVVFWCEFILFFYVFLGGMELWLIGVWVF